MTRIERAVFTLKGEKARKALSRRVWSDDLNILVYET